MSWALVTLVLSTTETTHFSSLAFSDPAVVSHQNSSSSHRHKAGRGKLSRLPKYQVGGTASRSKNNICHVSSGTISGHNSNNNAQDQQD